MAATRKKSAATAEIRCEKSRPRDLSRRKKKMIGKEKGWISAASSNVFLANLVGTLGED